jgi:hypothetical protein
MIVVLLLVVGYWWLVVKFLSMTPGWLPHELGYACSRRWGALSVMDCGITLTLLLIANFGALLFGWLTDVRRFGWEGHRGWRLGLALFTVLLVGLAMVKSLDAIRLPPDERLVEEAVAAFDKGDCWYLISALEFGVEGAEEACRKQFASDDLSRRIFAAVALWRWQGPREEFRQEFEDDATAIRDWFRADPSPTRYSAAFRARVIGAGNAARLRGRTPLPAVPAEFRTHLQVIEIYLAGGAYRAIR